LYLMHIMNRLDLFFEKALQTYKGLLTVGETDVSCNRNRDKLRNEQTFQPIKIPGNLW